MLKTALKIPTQFPDRNLDGDNSLGAGLNAENCLENSEAISEWKLDGDKAVLVAGLNAENCVENSDAIFEWKLDGDQAVWVPD